MPASAITILRPRDGDIVNRHDGTIHPDGLMLTVEGEAPEGVPVQVTCTGEGEPAGAPVTAERIAGRFRAQVPVRAHHCTVTAAANGSQAQARILWDRRSFPRYRFSLDDNILFLRDIAESGYRSIFDQWYLGFWRQMHDTYGTKVHVNIYYQTDDSVHAGAPFQLPQMPDRYRKEWQANSDWLRLTFHAWQNKPDRPYKDAGYDQLAHDFDAVTEQIKRFAGEGVLSTFTTVHWAEATREGVRALRDRGIRGLIALLNQRQTVPYTRYYMDEETATHAAKRDYWWDPDMDMVFVSCDCVVNSYKLEDIEPHLEKTCTSAQTAEVIELLIHEQYFRRELPNYQPDVKDKVVRAIEWVDRRGYTPVLFSEGFVGA